MHYVGERHGHVGRNAGGGRAVPAVPPGPDRPHRAVQEGGVRPNSTEPGNYTNNMKESVWRIFNNIYFGSNTPRFCSHLLCKLNKFLNYIPAITPFEIKDKLS